MAAVPNTMKVMDYQMYIGGEWVNAVSGKTFPVLDPRTGKVI